MSDRMQELREILTAEQIEPGLIEVIAENAEPFEGERPDSALEALQKRRRGVGQKAEIISKRTGNLLINWRDLITKVLPSSVLAAAASWANPYLGVFSCLALLRVVGDATEVVLSDDHSKVVTAIWERDGEQVRVSRLRDDASLDLKMPLDEILEDLATLRIIHFVDEDTILKIEHLVVLPDR